MATSFSTGLRNKMLTQGSFVDVLGSPVMHIYSGTRPESANHSIGGGTLLLTITDDDQGAGFPLEFDTTAVDGVLAKHPSQIWSGTVSTSGTATFFRIVNEGDDGSESSTAPRIQGRVGVAGVELQLANATLVDGQSRTISNFYVALPSAS